MPEIPMEVRASLLDLLDRRRAANDAAMWQAPVVLTAAQAFLLQVLANQEIGWAARLIVLVAGIGVTVAALLTLIRGRTREVEFSETVDFYLQRFGAPRIAALRVRGHGVDSGVPFEETMWAAGEWRDGKVTRWRNFGSEGEALEAAGLRE
jgi:hypothetical protein